MPSVCPEHVTSPLWNDLDRELRNLLSDDVYREWFKPLVCESESEDTLTLRAPSSFASLWINEHYLDILAGKANRLAGRPVSIKLTTDSSEASFPDSAPRTSGDRSRSNGTTARTSDRPSSRNKDREGVPLNPRYTFDNFVIGGGNQLAHAACLAVAQAPAKAYNPLFIYGDTGLGKTHLMHAVAHSILKARPESRIVYISSEKFINEFIRSIQENTISKFRRYYRNVDVLMIDDIHFLAGKERCQEEFFHTFNDLFEAHKQIFITSDRPANEISKLENRLVSRFQWGLVADIQSPDMETRLAILSNKAKLLNVAIPGSILAFLAEKVSRNVRRLEGALTRVASYASLVNQPLDIPRVERLLQDILHEEAQNQVSIEKIQRKVTEFFDLRMQDMTSKRRPNAIAFPRQIAMYLSRMLTGSSLQEIGEAFGGRDHGTVIHACKTVENMMAQDSDVRRNVDYLIKLLSREHA